MMYWFILVNRINSFFDLYFGGNVGDKVQKGMWLISFLAFVLMLLLVAVLGIIDLS